jgi:hypothetical protein
MWAGIWIGDHPEAVAHHLQAVVADDPTPKPRIRENRTATTEVMDRQAPLPHRVPIRPVPPGSVAATVLARSSGHCEVVADGCRFTADLQLSRINGSTAGEATSATTVYVACRPCAQILEGVDGREAARHLGFLVDDPIDAVSAPLYWRGTRWVLLGRAGELHETSTEQQSTWAS